MKNLTLEIESDIPPGAFVDYAGSTAPPGYLMCDGSVVSRVTYARLFSQLGTKFGAGDGVTTFKLPDFRGRISVGAGNGTGLTSRTVAQTFGAETHLLTEAEMASHTHVQDPHKHGLPSSRMDGSGAQIAVMNYTYPDTTETLTNSSATATNQNTGGGLAHNNMMRGTVLNKLVRY